MKRYMFIIMFFATSAVAQQTAVTVINRQYNDDFYNYYVPGYYYYNENSGCIGPHCYDNSYQDSVAPKSGTYSVRGVTLSLLLPDGKVAVANCDIKFAEHFRGPAHNHRPCRQPIIDNIQADFLNGAVKLEWPVSPDGKKTESETYTIVAILQKEK